MNSLNDIEQADLRRLIDRLCADPWVDGERKLDLRTEDVPRILYDDGEWSIVYGIINQPVLEIWGIARSRER